MTTVEERSWSTRSGAAPEVTRKLQEFLDAAGEPENVRWVQKVVAFDFLKQKGTRDAIPVLGAYSSDDSEITITTEAGGKQRGSTNQRLGDLAEATAAIIQQRLEIDERFKLKDSRTEQEEAVQRMMEDLRSQE